MDNHQKYYTRLEDYEVSRNETDKTWGSFSLGRREFLRLSIYGIGALSIFNSCRQPIREAIPWLIPPDDILPGESGYYATSFYDGSFFSPILAKVKDGRPLKIEGNNDFQGSSARAQASLLSLYHPGRIKGPRNNNVASNWESVINEITERLQAFNGENKKLWLITNPVIGPSTLDIISQFLEIFPNIKHCEYNEWPISSIIDAHSHCFGFNYLPEIRIDQAEVVVSFHCDFLGNWISPEVFNHQYSEARRRVNKSFRHIQVEAALSLTGSNADQRISSHHFEEETILAGIYNEIAQTKGVPVIKSIPPLAIEYLGVVDQLVNAGSSLVVSGSNNINSQMIICGINSMLNNYQKSILFKPVYGKAGNERVLETALDDIRQGNVSGVIIWGNDLVYDMGTWLSDSISQLDFSLFIGCHENLSSSACQYVCPDPHPYECWRDYLFMDGKCHLSQPLIAPLFDCVQLEDLLMQFAGLEGTFYQYFKMKWEKALPHPDMPVVPDSIPWIKAFKEGSIPLDEYILKAHNMDFETIQNLNIDQLVPNVELSITESPHYGTGMTIGNPWLLELPDPVSKVCWTNYASISAELASELNLKTGEFIEINNQLKLPVLVQPGQARNTVSVAWGYGRNSRQDELAHAGFSLSGWVHFDKNERKTVIRNISIRKTSGIYELPRTQVHDSQEGRALVLESDIQDHNQDHPHNEKRGFYGPPGYEGHKWGMVVDLNLCTGCNACLIACQNENNIPVVGPEEIKMQHEMNWIRIDRYYEGSSSNPRVHRQPVMCQHCGNAPCESVCPVMATSHSQEGINQMTYNRCIGTRYCSNNCPYKTRTFNWFDYNNTDAISGNTHDTAGMTTELARMIINPEVTQRSKGVMEKCTFCIQRIEEGKILAKLQNRPLHPGEIKTACMQACPTGAIVFGDINAPTESMEAMIQDTRSYRLLEELNTHPSVLYLAKKKR